MGPIPQGKLFLTHFKQVHFWVIQNCVDFLLSQKCEPKLQPHALQTSVHGKDDEGLFDIFLAGVGMGYGVGMAIGIALGYA